MASGSQVVGKSKCLLRLAKDLLRLAKYLRYACDMPAEVCAGGVQCAVFVIPCCSVIGISVTAFLLMFNFFLF